MQVRRDEMAAAQAILGVDHHWLGFVDSGLPEGDPLPPLPAGCFALEPLEVPVEALVREIRRYRPHVVTTYDENGGYPHPDHIRTHEVTVAAFGTGDNSRKPRAELVDGLKALVGQIADTPSVLRISYQLGKGGGRSEGARGD